MGTPRSLVVSLTRRQHACGIQTEGRCRIAVEELVARTRTAEPRSPVPTRWSIAGILIWLCLASYFSRCSDRCLLLATCYYHHPTSPSASLLPFPSHHHLFYLLLSLVDPACTRIFRVYSAQGYLSSVPLANPTLASSIRPLRRPSRSFHLLRLQSTHLRRQCTSKRSTATRRCPALFRVSIHAVAEFRLRSVVVVRATVTP